jgi:acyl-CoA thioester hydrolase
VTRHTYYCPIRWADMDVYGVVNNVSFVRYLEEARVDFIYQMPQAEQDSFFRAGSVVVRHEVDYRSQLVHRREPVEIQLWVSRLRAATVTVSYLIRDDDRTYVKARTVLAPFDYDSDCPRRFTPGETAFFSTYLETDPVAR